MNELDRYAVSLENMEVLRAQVEAQAREIERIDAGAKKIATYAVSLEQELAALKAKPSGVELPPHVNTGAAIQGVLQAIGIDGDVSYHLAGQVWNACLDEVARLNQPASGVYSADPLSCSGCVSGCFRCRTEPATAGDERAAFETWYLGHFYMGDKQCGLEWLSTEPCGGYRHQHPAEQWIVWQARAARSSPSHGEQVRHMVPQMVDFSPVPDDFRSQANGYRAGWNDCRDAISATPSAGSQKEQE